MNDELKNKIDRHEIASDFVQSLERFIANGFEDLAASNPVAFQQASELLAAGLSEVRLQIELIPLKVKVYLFCKESEEQGGHPPVQLFVVKLGTADLHIPGNGPAHLN